MITSVLQIVAADNSRQQRSIYSNDLLLHATWRTQRSCPILDYQAQCDFQRWLTSPKDTHWRLSCLLWCDRLLAFVCLHETWQRRRCMNLRARLLLRTWHYWLILTCRQQPQAKFIFFGRGTESEILSGGKLTWTRLHFAAVFFVDEMRLS